MSGTKLNETTHMTDLIWEWNIFIMNRSIHTVVNVQKKTHIRLQEPISMK